MRCAFWTNRSGFSGERSRTGDGGTGVCNIYLEFPDKELKPNISLSEFHNSALFLTAHLFLSF